MLSLYTQIINKELYTESQYRQFLAATKKKLLFGMEMSTFCAATLFGVLDMADSALPIETIEAEVKKAMKWGYRKAMNAAVKHIRSLQPSEAAMRLFLQLYLRQRLAFFYPTDLHHTYGTVYNVGLYLLEKFITNCSTYRCFEPMVGSIAMKVEEECKALQAVPYRAVEVPYWVAIWKEVFYMGVVADSFKVEPWVEEWVAKERRLRIAYVRYLTKRLRHSQEAAFMVISLYL